MKEIGSSAETCLQLTFTCMWTTETLGSFFALFLTKHNSADSLYTVSWECHPFHKVMVSRLTCHVSWASFLTSKKFSFLICKKGLKIYMFYCWNENIVIENTLQTQKKSKNVTRVFCRRETIFSLRQTHSPPLLLTHFEILYHIT